MKTRPGRGRDIARGGSGHDYVNGGGGRDKLLGGPGSDFLDGKGANDVLRGGGGIDQLVGNGRHDRCVGGGGPDYADGSCEQADTEMVELDTTVEQLNVKVASPANGLPHQASVALFQTEIIDDGDGPVLCIGGILTSDPPQCGGPVVDGLEMDPSWASTTVGVTTGYRSLVVSWPPQQMRVTLIDEYEGTWLHTPRYEHDFDRPAACAALTTLTASTSRQLNDWATNHPKHCRRALALESRVPGAAGQG